MVWKHTRHQQWNQAVIREIDSECEELLGMPFFLTFIIFIYLFFERRRERARLSQQGPYTMVLSQPAMCAHPGVRRELEMQSWDLPV